MEMSRLMKAASDRALDDALVSPSAKLRSVEV